MEKSYFFVTFLSGCWMTPCIAISIVNLTAEPQETLIPESDIVTTPTLNCTFYQLEPRDVIQEKGKLLIKNHNLILREDQPYVYEPILNLCFTRSEALNKEIFNKCSKRVYNKDDFSMLQNGSVKLHKDILVPGSYAIKNGILETCIDNYDKADDSGNSTESTETGRLIPFKVSVYIIHAACLISIIALIAHLVSFCLVPTQRNVAGCNMASLSTALLLAYSIDLIGQLPQVLGLFCVICGILPMFFFLAAIFCMNTLAFDVCCTMRMAANKLASFSPNAKRRHFIYYSIYSWGTPLLISATSVAMDNIEGSPKWMRPEYGRHGSCYINNYKAKLLFYDIPTFTLFVMNGIFFVMCAFLIKNNTMKCASAELQQKARITFVIYLRLGIMMGLIWLIENITLFAGFLKYSIVNLVINLMISLQGLYIFLQFTCSKKVYTHIREKLNLDAVLRSWKTSTTDSTEKTAVTKKLKGNPYEFIPYMGPSH